MKVVNLFGGSGIGKSTSACYLFSLLKNKGINVELVREFVKESIWEKRKKILGCQLKISGDQLYRQFILKDEVDLVVTDSPMVLGAIYDKEQSWQLRELLLYEFNKFDNINILLERTKPFSPHGRTENTIEESIENDNKIKKFLDDNNIEYHIATGDEDGCLKIMDIIKEEL